MPDRRARPDRGPRAQATEGKTGADSSMDFTHGHTPYDILELSNGPEATELEIRKAYKQMALRKHPDKNKGKPNAAAEFAELERAYRVLTDASARSALDDWINAKAHRAQRDAAQGDKRRKLREELEKRERQAQSGRSEEAIAHSRLQQELERLRKKVEEEAQATAASTTAAATAKRAEEFKAAAANGTGPPPMPDEAARAQLMCTVKVTWDPTTREYTAEQLRKIFAAHGTVVDVVMRARRSKSKRPKGSALVQLGSKHEADRAAGAVNGDVDDPLLVVPAMKVALEDGEQDGAGSWQAGNLLPPLAPLPTKPLFAVGSGQQGPAQGFPISFPQSSSAPQGPGTTTFPVASSKGAFSSFPSVPAASSFPGFHGLTPAGGAAGLGGAENAILEKMRRAAERERQLKAAQTEG